MRWYVSRNGETVGPVEEREVAEWFHDGMRDGMVRDEAGGPWTPIMQSPFALIKKPQPVASNVTAAERKQPKPEGGTKLLIAISVGLLALVAMSVGIAAMPPSADEIARRAAASDAKELAEAHARRLAREADPNLGTVVSQTTESESAKTVPLATLLSEYKDNEVRADGEFKGRRVMVTGIVSDVKKGLIGGMYIVIGTGKPFEIPALQCFPNSSQESAAAALSKGQQVSLAGTVGGLMMNVLLKGCVIQ